MYTFLVRPQLVRHSDKLQMDNRAHLYTSHHKRDIRITFALKKMFNQEKYRE